MAEHKSFFTSLAKKTITGAAVRRPRWRHRRKIWKDSPSEKTGEIFLNA